MNYNKIIKLISRKRFIIQLVLGIATYIAISYFHVSLWWIFGVGAFVGIIWGKVFCRWICPIGIIMEFMMKMSPDDSLKGMYQYHKLGCPIAWVSGFLNKVSLFKITLNEDTCKDCGLCDKACYMPTIDKQKFSLYKTEKINPAEAFSCSKCLNCVEQCPNGSLSYKPIFSINQYIKLKR
ncbi:MAG: 4Fe-4S binding protein [Bacteroidota bacterium]